MKEPWEDERLGLQARYQECPECKGDILVSGPELICECGYSKRLADEDRLEEDW